MNNLRLPPSSRKPNLRQTLQNQLSRHTNIAKLVQVLVGAILPIIEAILINKLTGTTDPKLSEAYYYGLAPIVILHAILFFITLLVEKPLTEFLVDFDNAGQEVEALAEEVSQAREKSERQNIGINTYLYSVISAKLSMEAVNNYLRNTAVSKDFDFYDKILDPWISERGSIFWFDLSDKYYNFALYLIDTNDKMLKKVWRRHGSSINAMNRDWPPGSGHIGMCFINNSGLLCNEVEVAKMTAQRLRRPEDKEYYRSFMAVPLRKNNNAVGVLIVTSCEPSKFEEAIHMPILNLMASILDAVL
jgi:uncharacterized protein with PQ loop repeat